MPVHRGRLGQLVGEVDDEAIADLGADQRPRQAAVVGPGRDAQLGGDLDVGHARGQVESRGCADRDCDPPARAT